MLFIFCFKHDLNVDLPESIELLQLFFFSSKCVIKHKESGVALYISKQERTIMLMVTRACCHKHDDSIAVRLLQRLHFHEFRVSEYVVVDCKINEHHGKNVRERA